MTTDPSNPKADPMDLTTYQELAGSTDILTKDDPLMPLLGLAGEVGQLIAEYKKRQRDVHGYRAFKDEVREELGDILWYAAALARHNGLDLGDIAQRNLTKTHDLFRSGGALPAHELFDAGLPDDQRFPDRLTVTLVENEETSKRGECLLRVRMYAGDAAVGDPLDDNAEHDDGYRYHDVFHLAHMAVLGWSPVMRRLLDRKRWKRPSIDRIEDGGRAAAIEEGLTAYVFTMAGDHSYFANLDHVPPSILKVCAKMTGHLEVSKRSIADWHQAVLAGYRAFRQVVEHRGGTLTADLIGRTLTYDTPPR
ncbi:MAG: nucleoside triphosphate pyrophosphohydrolase family protein [Actinobacteria bacterium]|nr:nucleoside triphosphate pyrophosphohydrolase family protein [Actinomycetota bacterium]